MKAPLLVGGGALPGSEVYVLRDSQVRPGGILIASVDGLILGDALRFGRAFCLRRVFAIQFEIWLRVSPVSSFSASFSCKDGDPFSKCHRIRGTKVNTLACLRRVRVKNLQEELFVVES